MKSLLTRVSLTSAPTGKYRSFLHKISSRVPSIPSFPERRNTHSNPCPQTSIFMGPEISAADFGSLLVVWLSPLEQLKKGTVRKRVTPIKCFTPTHCRMLNLPIALIQIMPTSSGRVELNHCFVIKPKMTSRISQRMEHPKSYILWNQAGEITSMPVSKPKASPLIQFYPDKETPVFRRNRGKD